MKLTYSTFPKLSDLSPGIKFKALLVFLHGLGDRGCSWIPFFERVAKDNNNILLIFPDAPTQPVTINGGMRMPSWYDIIHLDPTNTIEDRKGFEASSTSVSALIQELSIKYGIEKSFIGGFSQGGAIALYGTIKGYFSPSALIILSAYLPFANTDYSNHDSIPHKNIPIFWGHGTADPLIPLQWAKLSISKLQPHFKSITLKEYKGMGHSATEKEEDDVLSFILAANKD